MRSLLFVSSLLSVSASIESEVIAEFPPVERVSYPHLLPFPSPFFAASGAIAMSTYEHCNLLALDGSFARLTRICPDSRWYGAPCLEPWVPREAKFNNNHRMINFSGKALEISVPCEALLETRYAHAIIDAILPISFFNISPRQMKSFLANPLSTGPELWYFAILRLTLSGFI